MDKIELERYKEYKEEYDKQIRSLDYKIVETSVEMYNVRGRNSRDTDNIKVTELENKIDSYEREKKRLTDEMWNKIVWVKEKLKEIIKNKIKDNPSQKDEYLIAIFKINKITDVYFNVYELIGLSYLLDNETGNNTYENLVQNKQIYTISNNKITTEKETEHQSEKEEVKEGKQIEKIANNEENQVYLIKNEASLIPVKEEKQIALVSKPQIDSKGQEEISIENAEIVEDNKDKEKLENEISTDDVKEDKICLEEIQPKESDSERSFEEEFEKIKTIQRFNIEEQRIVDFENLLNHIIKTSKNYRTDIERALSRFIINYKIVKNTQYLQNDFDNITNNYLEIFKEIILKFKKDESIDALEDGIKIQELQIKELEKEILNNYIQMKEYQRQMQELNKVSFVKNYVNKIESQVAKVQGEQEINDKESITINNIFVPEKDAIDNTQNDVFQKIKKLSYDKRMSHIIEVSKWTKNVEEKLKVFYLEESDFQFVIYLIRQTENVCNANFEQIANLIINLCDTNVKLEVVERNVKDKNKKLKDEMETTQVLKDGIDNIKKKYSKIPFIGRKVLSILNVKMLEK